MEGNNQHLTVHCNGSSILFGQGHDVLVEFVGDVMQSSVIDLHSELEVQVTGKAHAINLLG